MSSPLGDFYATDTEIACYLNSGLNDPELEARPKLQKTQKSHVLCPQPVYRAAKSYSWEPLWFWRILDQIHAGFVERSGGFLSSQACMTSDKKKKEGMSCSERTPSRYHPHSAAPV